MVKETDFEGLGVIVIEDVWLVVVVEDGEIEGELVKELVSEEVVVSEEEELVVPVSEDDSVVV